VKASLATNRLFAPHVLLRAVAIICCIAGANALSQTTPSQPVSAALPTELIENRSAGNEALYNLDYAMAREKFTELRDRLPQHPARA
jgi:hypothetical protein